jgi:hypothetical protein
MANSEKAFGVKLIRPEVKTRNPKPEPTQILSLEFYLLTIIIKKFEFGKVVI